VARASAGWLPQIGQRASQRAVYLLLSVAEHCRRRPAERNFPLPYDSVRRRVVRESAGAPRWHSQRGRRRGREAGVTLCGLLRLDGADVRRSTLTSMLASSSLGLPAARAVHLDGPFGVVTAAGATGGPTPSTAVDDGGLTVVVVTAAHSVRARLVVRPAGGSIVGLASPRSPVSHAGSVSHAGPASMDRPTTNWRIGGEALPGGEPPGGEVAGGGREDYMVARRLVAGYRSVGERCLRGLAPDKLVIVWDSAVRRLLVARTGRLAADLLTWSDGRYIAFGTEQAQLLAAFRAPLFGQRPGPAGAVSPSRPRLVGTDLPSAVGLHGQPPCENDPSSRGRWPRSPEPPHRSSESPESPRSRGNDFSSPVQRPPSSGSLELGGPARSRRLGRLRQLAPGDLLSVSVAVARRGPRANGARSTGLRLVPRSPEPEPLEPEPPVLELPGTAGHE